MTGRSSTTLFWGTLAVLVLLVALLLAGGTNSRPLDPRSVSDDGAKALVDLVTGFGAEVALGVTVPDSRHQVAVLLEDGYGIDSRNTVEQWVRDGGVLVVADPTSPLTPRTIGLSQVAGGPCPVPAMDGIVTLEGATARYSAPGDGSSCFEGTVSVDPLGSGVVVGVGGPEPLLNEFLDQADNAVLAVSLLAPGEGTSVAFLEPRFAVDQADDSLVDLIPDPMWVLLAQLAVAFGIVAWWQARRLGAPVREPSAVVIEGSELAAARGRLLEGIGQPQAAAVDLRASTRRFLLGHLGLPNEAPTDVVASRLATLAAAAGSTTVTDAEVWSLLETRPVDSDTDLHALAVGLAELRDLVSSAPRSAAPTQPALTPQGEPR